VDRGANRNPTSCADCADCADSANNGSHGCAGTFGDAPATPDPYYTAYTHNSADINRNRAITDPGTAVTTTATAATRANPDSYTACLCHARADCAADLDPASDGAINADGYANGRTYAGADACGDARTYRNSEADAHPAPHGCTKGNANCGTVRHTDRATN
jgi:hypothetical protein